MKHSIVVGGGFRGILGALFLARGGERVTLVESAPSLGGVLASKSWKGFDLDLGCHLFDNRSDEETDLILEILGEDFHPVTVRYASKFLGTKSEGLAVPCFAGCDTTTQSTLLQETLHAASIDPASPNSLAELFAQRYGPTAARLLAVATRKAYRVDPSELDPASIDMTVLGRVALFDDQLSRTLKRLPRLDEVLAVRSDHDPLLFYRDRVQRRNFRNFYPSRHGMRGFCERAQALLESLGVELLVGTDLLDFERCPGRVRVNLRERAASTPRSIDAGRIVWSLGIERLAALCGHGEELAQHVIGVPMVLYYFTLPEVDAGEYSYVHDFDAGTLIFRASCPGNYGRDNRPAGSSYLCCEVPTERGSSVWNDPAAFTDRVWDEVRALGLSRGARFDAAHTMKVPSSYRVLRRGYSAIAARFAATLAGQDQIRFSSDQNTTKSRILESVRAVLAV